MNNEFRIDLAGNPDVASVFGDKKPGDRCEFTIVGKVKSVDPKGDAVVSIDKISYEEKGEEKEARPAPDAPMRMEMGSMSDEGEE
jgi:hypothetical protein